MPLAIRPLRRNFSISVGDLQMIMPFQESANLIGDGFGFRVAIDIVEAVPLDNFRLKLRFEDGTEGVVDVSQCVKFTGVFAPLLERAEFAAVQVNPELGTVCWPCGADLDPDVLYALVTGAKIPSSEKTTASR